MSQPANSASTAASPTPLVPSTPVDASAAAGSVSHIEVSHIEAAHSDPSSGEAQARPKEIGGRGGLEPTRYGDWEKNGRCIDF
jgi:hypothetical protein